MLEKNKEKQKRKLKRRPLGRPARFEKKTKYDRKNTRKRDIDTN